jgi:hypothetical protein
MPELRKSYVETVRAAQKLLGVPTIGGGSARAGGGGGGSQRSQIRPHASWKTAVSLSFGLINRRKCCFFAQKFLTRYTPETFFEEYINF